MKYAKSILVIAAVAASFAATTVSAQRPASEVPA